MQISFNKVQNYNNYPKQTSFPSFRMKKAEMGAVNKYVFENFFQKEQKPDIQKFNVIDEFYAYCKNYIEKIIPKNFDFGGRQPETQAQRKAMIDEWFNYVTKENDAYTGAIQLMILKSITKGLKPNEDVLPPALNKGVLANTISEVQKTLEENPKALLKFDKIYRNNLQKSMLAEEGSLDKNLNGWIKIPSKKHDPANFEANVDRLKTLSHGNWCTKSYNAEPYLADGDFHVYMENGKPKLGVRFVGDEIQEIQGELNNSKIPLKYGDIAEDHIKDYELRENAKREIQNLETVKKQMEKFKAKFKNGIENASTQEILENYGIKCKKDTDGLLIISHYGKGEYEFGLSDLGIDETKLFKDIKIIEGEADFRYSQVQSLGNLQSIGGWADFSKSQIKDLCNLQSIGGNAYFNDSQVQSLGNLQSIGGGAFFSYSQIKDLGNLQSIGGNADFNNSQIKDLGNLQSIGGDAYFRYSQVQSLGNLQSIGGDADFRYSQVKDLGNLQSIGGNAYFRDSPVQSLGNLHSIGGNAYFNDSQVQSLGNLQSIGGWAVFENSQVKDLGNLKSIGDDAYIENSSLTKKDFETIKVGGKIKG